MEQYPAKATRRPILLVSILERIGRKALWTLEHTGAVLLLLCDAAQWVGVAMVNRRIRIGWAAIVSQIIRSGVRAVGIIALVSASVGLILAFQLAPPLDEFGQRDKIANIIGVAILRELGPLIASIVLTGFAGAAIAAEIGTMVVGEEIEALRAHALNPVRFLVVPRVLAATVSMTALAVMADVVAIVSALGIAVTALDIPYSTFMDNMLDQVKLVDFLTGIWKASIFGMLIGIIACANGLAVTGGAAGVGRATTRTVVESVVAIIVADLIFTTIFYSLDLV